MAVDHRTKRHSELFKGLDKRSSDIRRTSQYATDLKNCSIRLSGALNKRKGFHINTRQEDTSHGVTSFSDRNADDGSITEKLLMANKNVNILNEYDFTVGFNHPTETTEHAMTLDIITKKFTYSIYNINTDTYMYGPTDLGDGLQDQDKTITDLVTEINKVRVPVLKATSVAGLGGSTGNYYSTRLYVSEYIKEHSNSAVATDTIQQQWMSYIHKAANANVASDFTTIPASSLEGYTGVDSEGNPTFDQNNSFKYFPISSEAYPLLYHTYLTQSEINRMLIKPDDSIPLVAQHEDTTGFAYMPAGKLQPLNENNAHIFIRVAIDSQTNNPILVDAFNNSQLVPAGYSVNHNNGAGLTNLVFNEFYSLTASYAGPSTSKAALIDVLPATTVNPSHTVQAKEWDVLGIPLLDKEISTINTNIAEATTTASRNIPVFTAYDKDNSANVLGDSVNLENVSFAELNNVMYISNGYDDMLKYDGDKLYKPGLPEFKPEWIKKIVDKDDSDIYYYDNTGDDNPITSTLEIGSNKFRYNYKFRFSYEDAKGNLITGQASDPIEFNSVYSSFRANEYTVSVTNSAGGTGEVSLGIVKQVMDSDAKKLSSITGYTFYSSTTNYPARHKFDIPSEETGFFTVGTKFAVKYADNSYSTTFTVTTIGTDYVWTTADPATTLTISTADDELWKPDTSPGDVVTNIEDSNPKHKLFFNQEAIESILKPVNTVGFDVESEFASNYTQERKGENGETVSIEPTGKKIQIEIFRTKMYNPGGNSLEVAGQYYYVGSIGYDGNQAYNVTTPDTEFSFDDTKADEIGKKTYSLVNETGNGDYQGFEYAYGITGSASLALNPFLIYTDSIKRHDPPPRGKYIRAFKNVLLISGQIDNVNNIQYSLATNFATGEIGSEYFPKDDNGIVIQSDFGDSITGIAGLRDLLYVFHRNSVHVIGGNLSEPVGIPYAVDLLTKEGGAGCQSHNSIIEFQNSLVFLSGKGIYSIDATNSINELSANIKPLFDDNTLSKNRAIAYNWVDKNNLIFSIPIESKTTDNIITTSSNLVVVYDYFNQAWLQWDNLDFSGGVQQYKDNVYFMSRKSDKSTLHTFSNTKTSFDYTDHTNPINFTYETNWESLDNPTVFKKFLRIKLFSFDGEGTFENPEGFELTASLQTNYIESDVGEILFNFKEFTGGGWGYFKWGTDRWGNEQSSTLKSKLLRNKAKCLKIRFNNDSLNENILLTSYELEIAAPFRTEIKE